MECQGCTDVTEDYEKDIHICGRCRKVKKAELVHIIMKWDTIYLTENKRNDNGRPRALTPDEAYEVRMRTKHESYQQIADDIGVSKSTVYKAVKGYYER